MILHTALICLASNIFFESRSESVVGQYAVAQVTMRRAEGKQSKVCAVTYAKNQFSWTRSSKLRRLNPALIDPDAWYKAQRIATMVLEGRADFDLTGGATHYHATYVHPKWSFKIPFTKQIGNHIFYKATQA